MMKRLCALVLALLFVTACPSAGFCAGEYDALHDQLNAENYEGIIEELCSLSPVFAERYSAIEEELLLLEKYRSLIDSLEERDYTAAQAGMDQLIRETSSEYEAVEITGENWSEYFYVSIEEQYDVDYFGNPDYYRLDSRIKLKDEYLIRLVEEMENDVRFNLHFVNEPALVSADFVNKGYEVLHKISPPVSKTCEVQAVFWRNADNERSFSGNFAQSGYSDTDENGNVRYLRDFFLEYEVLDAIGTIWLYKE